MRCIIVTCVAADGAEDVLLTRFFDGSTPSQQVCRHHRRSFSLQPRGPGRASTLACERSDVARRWKARLRYGRPHDMTSLAFPRMNSRWWLSPPTGNVFLAMLSVGASTPSKCTNCLCSMVVFTRLADMRMYIVGCASADELVLSELLSSLIAVMPRCLPPHASSHPLSFSSPRDKSASGPDSMCGGR